MSRRHRIVAAALAIGALAVGSCGDDDDGSDVAASLADDPSVDECLDATATVLGRLEIPDDFEPSDGVDDDERAAVDEALDDAAEGYFDPSDEDHPCFDALQSASPEQVSELFSDLDPDVIALLTTVAESEVEVVTEPDEP